MIKSHLLPLIIAFISLGTLSCNQCIGFLGKEKVVCSNGGTCNDGTCDCLKGYSGSSCDSLDLCELNDVVCVYGACEDGDCFCQSGYQGEFCDIETRQKFIGKYRVIEACSPLDTVGGYDIEIQRDLLDASKVEILNLFSYSNFPINGFFSKIKGTANANTMNFGIYGQSPDGNIKTISGTGIIDLSDTNEITIVIDYTVVNGNKEYTCQLNGYQLD